ncbi:MAG: ABC transporter permease [Verrucomicrobiales bacterium]|nr:ABC transporter permease [Verrucomicrobiales bacterium]|tara:strand:+ start:892 stop:1680 length:789 start_codon:yes stop_codon:yes gene_type:complete
MNEATGVLTQFVLGLGRITLMGGEVLRSLATVRPNLREVVRQLHFIGVKSQSVVLITGGFAGMVLCAQTFFQFEKVDMGSSALAVVSVAMTGEMGPVLAGLMVAGRIGAAITAELGTMRVTEQIDALRTMATHPVDHLVVPRVLATVIAMPLLTVIAVSVGIVCAYVVGTTLLGMDGAYSIKHMAFFTDPIDLWAGLIKSVFFGAVISVIGCYRGLNCGQGAEGVGRATNQAVVHSCITILISNFFLTLFLRKFFMSLGMWG